MGKYRWKCRVHQWILFGLILFSGCGKKTGNPSPPAIPDSSGFAKGADISWVTEMEASGRKFYNASGDAMDCFDLMQSLGINSIRLRAWVNPADGWCNTSDLVAKAKRARAHGMRIMVDFHYSDSWADPGHQTKPLSWQTYDFTALSKALTDYTTAVMDTLKSNGIIPSWVQIGNETNDGMLWEDGRASVNMAQYAALTDAGYQAVKSFGDSIKVIVHISNGYDNNLFRWVFDGLKANGAHWDMIGMSLYPSAANWQTLNTQCLANMKDMIARYNTPVMICETGMPVNDPATCLSFLSDLISKTRSIPDNKGCGVFYWEPESYKNWNGYGLGAFDDNGKPTIAMNAFAD
jgi:arabinogalactan endo-1,4-beta-galactosidase